jgi:lipopolysaccharide biosynthesis protein
MQNTTSKGLKQQKIDGNSPANEAINTTSEPRIIAFFLTQYHPIPENDAWWGKGFTEWTNVTKATQLFAGHHQPHLPADLGFYDLRLKETRHAQYKLAKEYGIDGFCYYYYWFSGKKILHRPLEDMLFDAEQDMPFCLCWANENWSRRWDAAEHEVLLAQRYLPEDNLNFIKSLEPYLKDKRYIKKDGKPLLIVYRPQHLPNAIESSEVWRNYCREAGIGEIHICAALTHGNLDYKQFGFDSGVEFPPHNLENIWINEKITFYNQFKGYICQYKDLANLYLNREYDGTVYKTVFPSWDNTARRKQRALIILNGTPRNYEHWLSLTIDKSKQNGSADGFIFINAWNEWAEGCHLEPDDKWGRAYLESTARAKSGERKYAKFLDFSLPSNDIEQPPSLLDDIASTLLIHYQRRYRLTTKYVSKHPFIKSRLKAIASRLKLIDRPKTNE